MEGVCLKKNSIMRRKVCEDAQLLQYVQNLGNVLEIFHALSFSLR